MRILTNDETLELLRPYLKGILQVGLIEPLLKIAENGSSQVSLAAKSLYRFQLAGILPESAIMLMQPALPNRVARLLAAGFEQSNVDLVMGEAIKVLEANDDSITMNELLDGLLEKCSSLTTEEICQYCAGQEIEKLKKRSEIEGANFVVVDYLDGFLRQRFSGSWQGTSSL
jgi:hypothetical protein